MRDQDVITLLVDLHDHIEAPASPAGEDARRGRRLVRRRRTVSVAAAAAAVLLAVGIVQAELPDGRQDLQPAPAPSVPAPPDPTEAAPPNGEVFEREMRQLLARVPGWSIADKQLLFTATPCAGSWSSAATGSGGGNFDVSTSGRPGQMWHEVVGFTSAAEATSAVDRLVENLASCTTVEWRTAPIILTGARLASSADGVIWVYRNRAAVSILEVVTTEGPPPLSVQREVAQLMWADAEARRNQ
jgi:hypothetical protein